MGRFSNTPLHVLRQAFPEPEWQIRNVGQSAADVFWRGRHVGLVSMNKKTGKWACALNSVPPPGSPRFAHDTPQQAALAYYEQWPDLQERGVLAALQAVEV